MPYTIVKDHPDCEESETWGVVKDDDSELMGCHASEESAADQMAALYAAESERATTPLLSRTAIIRQTDGSYRWLSISCSAVLNRVGEIDSSLLFDRMILRAKEGRYPYRTFFHLGEPAQYGQCDFMARDGYMLITSGVYDTEGPNGDLAHAEIRAVTAASAEWGESIKYFPIGPPTMIEIDDGIFVPAFDDGYCIEISLLPEQEAAALFTSVRSIEKEDVMNERIRAALEKLGIGGDRISELAEQVDERNRAVDDLGLIARENEAEAPAEETDVAPAEDAPEPIAEDEPIEELANDAERSADDAAIEFVADEAVVSAIAELVTDALRPELAALSARLDEYDEAIRALPDIAEAVAAHGDHLDALSRSDEEKKREWLQDLPRRQHRLVVGYRPTVDRAEEGEPEEESMTDKATRVLETKVLPAVNRRA